MVTFTVRPAILAGAACLSLLITPSTGRCDTVYAVSFSNGELVRYDSADPQGTLTTLVASGQLEQPSAVTLGPDGNLYIGTSGDGLSIAPAITRYEISSGTLSPVYSFGVIGTVPGSLAFQGTSLLVGRNPLLADVGPIVRLTNVIGGGEVTASNYSSGSTLASSPGLAVGADGSFYVSDQSFDPGTGVAFGPVKRFDASGNYVGEVIADGAAGLAGPTGLVLRGTTLYTASIETGAVLATDLTTTTTQTFGTTGQQYATGVLASLSDGGLLAGDPLAQSPNEIYRFDAQGTLIESYSLGLGEVGGIVTIPVPEPATLTCLGLTAVAGGLWARRRLSRSGAS
jgi:hypothetical protein